MTAGLLEFFQQRKPGDKPFFLLAGYLTPHFPLIVPEQYWAPYKDQVPMPVIPEGFLESLPLNYQHLRVGFHVEHVPPELVKKGRELYYGLTEWMDAEVGKVLAALQASAAASNTVVIYTADHGENMGEHGLWWKNAMYEPAARVPLIVLMALSATLRVRPVIHLDNLDLVHSLVSAAKVPHTVVMVR